MAVRDKDVRGLRAAFARGVPLDHPLDDSDNTALHFACTSGWVEGVELLLAAGADARALNKAGYTPLHSAAQSGLRLPVEMLLAQGVEVDARSISGRTPLFVAATAPQGDAVRALLAVGANPLVVCPAENYTPVFSAALGTRDDAVRAFMEAGGEAAELLKTEAFWAEVRRVFAPQSDVGEAAIARARRVVTSFVTASLIEEAMPGIERPPTSKSSAPGPL